MRLPTEAADERQTMTVKRGLFFRRMGRREPPQIIRFSDFPERMLSMPTFFSRFLAEIMKWGLEVLLWKKISVGVVKNVRAILGWKIFRVLAFHLFYYFLKN